MSYELVIAEKPSVAKCIAAVVGAKEKKNRYLEGNGYRITWCYGHLTRYLLPEEIDPGYKSWDRELLPILPEEFHLTVVSGQEEHMEFLKDMINDPETERIINACDAGREGEAIFRNVLETVHSDKPVFRLWISSMEESAIRKGFEELKPQSEYDLLYEAARCRSEADWLVGMNATRLFSKIYEEKLNTGRVISPTLTAIVNREKEIEDFKPTPYYRVVLEFDGFNAESGKFTDRNMAQELLEMAKGKAIVRDIQTIKGTVSPPTLFDLTSLQRDANRWYSFTAQETLDYLQMLYEKRLITYPRTDSKYLTSGMKEQVKRLFNLIVEKKELEAVTIYERDKLFDDSKVSDHHAILPTIEIKDLDPDSLLSGERKLLDLLCERLILAFSEDYEYEETEVTLESAGDMFKAKTHKTIRCGYKEIVKMLHPQAAKEEPQLPAMEKKMSVPIKGSSLVERKTQPPKHYTEDLLLLFMENAQDQEMPENAERKGLGTPATRAGIIEKLIRGGFLERKKVKKHTCLLPTRLGTSFVSILPETLRSAKMTAEWEIKLEKVRKGELSGKDFRKEVDEYIKTLVETYQKKEGDEDVFAWRHETVGTCPRCGGKVVERLRFFACVNDACDFKVWKNNRFFSKKKIRLDSGLMKNILEGKPVLLRGCYSEEKDIHYDALVTLQDDGQETQYLIEFPKKRGA